MTRDDLIAWARENGIDTDRVPADSVIELHVTDPPTVRVTMFATVDGRRVLNANRDGLLLETAVFRLVSPPPAALELESVEPGADQ